MKPQNIFRHCVRFILFPAVLLIAARAGAEVVVIVSAENKVPGLTTEQTARIFLGKTSTFPDDSAAFPIDQPEGSAVRNEFYSRIVHKSPSQLAAYWAKIIFSGNGRPPELLDGDVAVRKAVAENPYAIGYVNKNAVDSSVRVILAPRPGASGK